MSCGNVNSIRIEPANVYWKMQEQWCVCFSGVTAAGIGGQYINLYKPDGTAYYAWFDENNTDTDPAPASKTEIEVSYAASATTSAIATAFASAVDAIVGFKATVSANDPECVVVTAIDYGNAADWDNGTATTVVLDQLSEGRNFDLGLLDGDIELSFEEQLFEVTAHQTGATKIADLRQGLSAEVTTTLQEADSSKLREIFGEVAGSTITPVAGTELFGWGTSKLGQNTILEAGKLILHPVRLAAGDYSEDLCFWRAYPMPESLTFSGENPKLLSITWKIYKDENIDSKVNMFAFGDWTQYAYED